MKEPIEKLVGKMIFEFLSLTIICQYVQDYIGISTLLQHFWKKKLPTLRKGVIKWGEGVGKIWSKTFF